MQTDRQRAGMPRGGASRVPPDAPHRHAWLAGAGAAAARTPERMTR
jgi:hypothetical protein